MDTVHIYIDKETIRVDDDRGTAYKLSGYYTGKLESEGTLDDTELIGFGYEIFHSIFSTKERMDRITKRLDGLSNNEHLILTISSEILDVHNIPFELINRDGSDNGFLLKKRNISILRGIPTLDKKITSSPSPVRILIILSEPLNIYKTAPLDLLKELAVIYKALDEYIIKGIVEIDVEEKADKATIRERLLKGRYHIVHFAGHGSKGGELFIEDERDSRYARTIGADELKDIFKGSGVKLFYFDACETASSSEMNPSLAYHIYKGVPSAYVIANLVSVRDDAATDVTREIYKTIFDEGIENTLNSARLRLFEDWWKPVLFGESGKRLFEIKENHVIKKKRLVKRPPETAGNYVYRLAIVRNASDLIEKGNYLVLHGIGGAGKSTMANYLSRFYDAKFKNILFFDLKDKGITGPETLLNEILKGLAGEDIVKYDGIKGLLDSKKPVEILNRQKWRLITETLEEKTLFILDNLEETMQDEEGIIKPGWKDLIGSIMQTGNIFTIFTSRMIIRLNNREKLSNVLEIGEYERAEVGFLLSGMSEDDRDYFMSRSEEIYKKLGLHPLSISKAVET
ncbi:MAG: CHAT domain-containing protein, partial [Nitrospinae bacterium]|nr:CHAT domain-containing protein [Nitrospinota bacterium]